MVWQVLAMLERGESREYIRDAWRGRVSDAAIAETIRLGRRTLVIIRFNISFALGLKALFLALTLIGRASLWLAIMADTGATLLVVANTLRLLRSR